MFQHQSRNGKNRPHRQQLCSCNYRLIVHSRNNGALAFLQSGISEIGNPIGSHNALRKDKRLIHLRACAKSCFSRSGAKNSHFYSAASKLLAYRFGEALYISFGRSVYRSVGIWHKCGDRCNIQYPSAFFAPSYKAEPLW